MIQRALQCCRFGDRFVEDPVPRFSSTGAGTSAATAPASAPNRNPEKELGDVGQQPQRRVLRERGQAPSVSAAEFGDRFVDHRLEHVFC